MSKVTVWTMTEQERLAYIEKHPIIPTEHRSGSTFAYQEGRMKEKGLKGLKAQGKIK